jgi:glycosyltransferase involved in cell wall biosynthesis
MLSILIPTYNYTVFDLVSELKNQCDILEIDYEIICQDDNSDSVANFENNKINALEHCSLSSNAVNFGRAKNRNSLAQKATFPYLLFLDADTFPIHKNFISTYISAIDDFSKIIYGGIRYQNEKPIKEKLLRWIYGKVREALSVSQRNKNKYLSFLTLNFLIHKDVFAIVSFNETIPNLRHEDTLFSYEVMKNKIPIVHIENPVFHYGLDEFEVTIKKEQESLLALKNLLEKELLPTDYVKISKVYFTIKKIRIKWLVANVFIMSQSLLLKNISSANPSLFLFDVYRIGYLCTL